MCAQVKASGLLYPDLPQRRALAEELRDVLSTAAQAFAECPKMSTDRRQAPAEDAKSALKNLCADQSDRPQAFDLRTHNLCAYLVLRVWWMARICLVGLFILIVMPPLLQNYANCKQQADGVWGGCTCFQSVCVQCVAHSNCPGNEICAQGTCQSCGKMLGCDHDSIVGETCDNSTILDAECTEELSQKLLTMRFQIGLALSVVRLCPHCRAARSLSRLVFARRCTCSRAR